MIRVRNDDMIFDITVLSNVSTSYPNKACLNRDITILENQFIRHEKVNP